MNITDVTGDVPLIIAAHGTRDADGVAVCRALVDRVRSMLPGRRVTLGFVELAEPTIAEAVREALDGREITGDTDAVVVPLMLATGGHVREDIPEAFDEGRGDADVRYARCCSTRCCSGCAKRWTPGVPKTRWGCSSGAATW